MNDKKRTRGKLVSALLAGGLLVVLAVALLVLSPAPPVNAWVTPCDFMTGGGFIIYKGNHANFGVGGGCKHGSGTDGAPYWGHLEYQDHGSTPPLNVHWTSITYYVPDEENGVALKTGQPTGTRHICGTARTNYYGDVDFHVRARDAGEPGVNDQFDIRLKKCPAVGDCSVVPYLYDTTAECFPHFLGSSAPCAPGNGGGGNIQLHKPNPSTTGVFGGSCPQW